MKKSNGLGRQAFEALPEGQEYQPFVPASESPMEFTLKAVLPGVLFGILFGAGEYVRTGQSPGHGRGESQELAAAGLRWLHENNISDSQPWFFLPVNDPIRSVRRGKRNSA